MDKGKVLKAEGIVAHVLLELSDAMDLMTDSYVTYDQEAFDNARAACQALKNQLRNLRSSL